MKLGILGPNQNYIGYTTQRLLEEAKKEFDVKLISVLKTKLKIEKELDVIYENDSLTKFDYILPRIDSKRAEIGYPIIRFLDHLNVKKPYPSESVLIAHNKFITLEKLVANNIPVPATYMTGSKESAKEIIKKHKLPLILKLLSGFGGHGVMIMDTKEAAQGVIETMKTLKQEILIEEFLPNPGEDVRGIVAGEEVIASYKRVAAKGEKKTNISSGGKGISFQLTGEMEDICIRSAKAIKSKIAAVDMIDSKDGVKVIEVNINPGLKGIEKTTNLNIAQKIIQFVKSELKN